MEKRIINIGISFINDSLVGRDEWQALALAIKLKGMFGSSIVPNFSIRKIIELSKSRHSIVSNAIKTGTQMGLFEFVYTYSNRIDLKINKLWNGKEEFVKFNIYKPNRYENTIYLENGKGTIYNQIANSNSIQSLSDVMDKILQAKIINMIRNHECVLDSMVYEYYTGKNIKVKLKKLSVCRVLKLINERRKDLKAKETNIACTGFSYNKMLEKIDPNNTFLSRYKIAQIIKLSKEEGLIRSYPTYMLMSTCINKNKVTQGFSANIIPPRYNGSNAREIFEWQQSCDIAWNNFVEEEYLVRDENYNVIEDLHQRGFEGKGKDRANLYKRMGDTYFVTSDIFGKKKQKKENTSKKKCA